MNTSAASGNDTLKWPQSGPATNASSDAFHMLFLTGADGSADLSKDQSAPQ